MFKDAVRAKTKKLIKEGMGSKQAYAAANNMKKEGKVGPKGGYKKKGY